MGNLEGTRGLGSRSAIARPRCGGAPRWIVLSFACAAGALLLTAPALRAEGQSETWDLGEVVLERHFPAQKDQRLLIDVPDVDVEILGGDAEETVVKIFLDARNMERARERYEDLEIRVTQRDGDVRIVSNRRSRRSWHWQWNWPRGDSYRITIQVHPAGTAHTEVSTSDGDIFVRNVTGDATLETSDGDIRLESHRGDADLETSDGDISVEDLTGEADLHTSDGDIDIEGQRGPVRATTSDGGIMIRDMEGSCLDAETSDGSVRLTEIHSPNIYIRTSDGEIEGDGIEAEEMAFHTSDGDIDLEAAAGGVDASTGDGDIAVEFSTFGESRLRTGEGDIWIAIPRETQAELDFEAERIRIPETSRFSGRIGRHHASGALNEGGPELEATSDEGEIVLRLRESR